MAKSNPNPFSSSQWLNQCGHERQKKKLASSAGVAYIGWPWRWPPATAVRPAAHLRAQQPALHLLCKSEAPWFPWRHSHHSEISKNVGCAPHWCVPPFCAILTTLALALHNGNGDNDKLAHPLVPAGQLIVNTFS